MRRGGGDIRGGEGKRVGEVKERVRECKRRIGGIEEARKE